MCARSAAHTLLPLPSYARVTNLANGKTVIVRVNDRGPFHEDRLIDLSYVAAQRLGLLGQGSGMVEVEAIIPGSDAQAGAQDLPKQNLLAPAHTASAVSAEPGGL